jgi:leucyl-tRNA synthetase
VTNGAFNYTGHANIANWPKVLAEAKKLNVRTVLPGHGPPGGADLIDGEAQFMTELHKAVQDAQADEVTLRILHQTIKKVTEDLDTFGFNTAISQMIFQSSTQYNVRPQSVLNSSCRSWPRLLPGHICEELWARLATPRHCLTNPGSKFK